MHAPAPVKTVVLVVDDLADSRFLMRCSLLSNGFEVVEAVGGSEALALLPTVNPDVVVLDVCMPGMSGYEVCRAIRARPETCKLPLILVSAVADRSAVALGFASGAVDFLSKPFRAEELCARVAVHAELNRARRQLEDSHARLAALNREKDLMFGMAAHDLRGPIAVIMGFAENALAQMRGGESRSERQALEVILRESEHMQNFLGTLLDLNELERGDLRLKLRETDLGNAARSAVERAEPAAARKSLTLRLILSDGSAVVRADVSGVRRILDNLISNALKFTPAGGRVTVRVSPHAGEVQCVVSDDGPGLTSEDMERVFTRFARLSAKPTAGEKSTGLGLAICRALAEGMGGRTWCGNNAEGGAFFGFAIPVSSQETPEASASPFAGIGVDGAGHSVSPFPHLLANRAPA